MNTKFFDLQKNKQDRIINGSLKIICRYGYRHASTDEIVAEAGISKGLLFHYFISKKGLVRFLYDYCSHYVLDELRRTGLTGAEDYMAIQERLLRMEATVMEIYPCMLLFLSYADRSADAEVAEALQDLPLYGAVSRRYGEILSASGLTLPGNGPLSPEEMSRLTTLLTYLRLGVVRDMLRREDFRAETFLAECTHSLHLIRKMAESQTF